MECLIRKKVLIFSRQELSASEGRISEESEASPTEVPPEDQVPSASKYSIARASSSLESFCGPKTYYLSSSFLLF